MHFSILTLRSSLVFLSKSIYTVNRLSKSERAWLKTTGCNRVLSFSGGDCWVAVGTAAPLGIMSSYMPCSGDV